MGAVMASYNRPDTGRICPGDATSTEHAIRLEADSDSVSNTAIASLSNTSLLPTELEAWISRGIEKGIAEARSYGYCPHWSEIDKSTFREVILKNISSEASLEARDRILQPQSHGLHESYDAPHAKFALQMPRTTMTHQLVGAGAAIEATSVVDLVNAARKRNIETESVHGSNSMDTICQESKAKDVSGEKGGTDFSSEEVSMMDECEDAGHGQEIIPRKNNESADDFSEDGSTADGSGSHEEIELGSEPDSDIVSEDEEDKESQPIVREESVRRTIGDRSGFSTVVNLKIEQQGSVNRLEGMTALDLMNCVSLSLKDFLGERQLLSKGLRISLVDLLDNGNVDVLINAETREILRTFDSAGWDRDFERTLIGSPISTCKVEMHNTMIRTLEFKGRKEKSVIIRQLAYENRAIGPVDGVGPLIRDIYWSTYPLPKVYTVLIVEFLDPKQATQALVRGLYWQGRHSCSRPDKKDRLVRCSRCQGYGHLLHQCSAPHRCGKCAEQHPTAYCKSEKMKCVSCGGGHYAGSKQCSAKIEARRTLGFVTETTSEATAPAAEAQTIPSRRVRPSISTPRTEIETSMPSPVSLDANPADDKVKSESDQSLPEADPSPFTYPDTANLLKQIEDLRKIVIARETALQTESSGRLKRRAVEAFAAEEETESSTVAAKRIKQERSTRESSMGLYRQPSPFIVNRPQ